MTLFTPVPLIFPLSVNEKMLRKIFRSVVVNFPVDLYWGKIVGGDGGKLCQYCR